MGRNVEFDETETPSSQLSEEFVLQTSGQRGDKSVEYTEDFFLVQGGCDLDESKDVACKYYLS